MTDKWWDISDDDLDNIFRDAAEENTPSFDGAAWNKMQEKLDGSSKNRKPMGYKTWWWSAGLLLLLITGITYFKFNQSNQKEENLTVQASKQNENSNAINQEKLVSTTPKTDTPSAENAKNVKETDSKSGQELNRIVNENAVENKDNTQEAIAKETKINVPKKGIVLEKSKNETSISPKTKEFSPNNTETVVAKAKVNRSKIPVNNPNHTTKDKIVPEPNRALNENDKIYLLKSQAANEVIEENATPNTTTNFTHSTPIAREKKQLISSKAKKGSGQEVESLAVPVTISTEASVLSNSEKAINQTAFVEESTPKRLTIEANSLESKGIRYNAIALKSEIPNLFDEPLFVLDNQPQKTRIERPKHGIQLTVSPDFNSVEKLSPSAFGGSLGILYDYEFAHRLRVQIGGIYTVKKYNAAIQTYHAWENAQWAANPVTDIDADCRILDIPINIRYDAWRAPKYDVFVSTGLSSYLMLFEHYNYNYQNPPHYPKVIDQYRAGDYSLSSFNFSLGYDRQIGKSFTIQVEPYMKFALRQVGLGKVNLYSTGVLFSIKHQFGGRLRLNK